MGGAIANSFEHIGYEQAVVCRCSTPFIFSTELSTGDKTLLRAPLMASPRPGAGTR
jgi:hypothetical protein